MTRVSTSAEGLAGTAEVIGSSPVESTLRSSRSQRPETNPQTRIVYRRLPIMAFGEVHYVLLAVFWRHHFARPDAVEVILEDHAEFPGLKSVANVRGQFVH